MAISEVLDTCYTDYGFHWICAKNI